MRSWTPALISLCAAGAAAQSNAFNVPPAGYSVSAGGSVNLTWTNVQGSTVTIKLQSQSNITPNSGVVLADKIQNNGGAIVSIPSGASLPSGAYTFEIIDDDDTSDMNFSPSFSISGASGTGSLAAATASNTASAPASNSSSSSSGSTTSSSASSTSASVTTSTTSSSSAAASTTTSAAQTTSSAIPNANMASSPWRAQGTLTIAAVLIAAVGTAMAML